MLVLFQPLIWIKIFRLIQCHLVINFDSFYDISILCIQDVRTPSTTTDSSMTVLPPEGEMFTFCLLKNRVNNYLRWKPKHSGCDDVFVFVVNVVLCCYLGSNWELWLLHFCFISDGISRESSISRSFIDVSIYFKLQRSIQPKSEISDSTCKKMLFGTVVCVKWAVSQDACVGRLCWSIK